MTREQYHSIAGLFDYPDAVFHQNVQRVLTGLDEEYPQAAREVELFHHGLPTDGVYAMGELYTRSFDVQAITTLDIGYVLFGDDYKRGELLANLNREHQQAGNNCGHELADHLPNVLRLMAILTDEELISELVGELLAPALQQMISEFDPGRVEQKSQLYKKHYKTLIDRPQDDATIYVHALKALWLVLQQDFVLVERAVGHEHGREFLQSMSAELSVEQVSKE